MPEHKSLLSALVAVQSACPTIKKDSENPHFRNRYASLDAIISTVRPLLAEQQLVWTTLPGADEDGRPILEYRLLHAPTGEVLDGTVPLLLAKNDAQGFGSALSYFRRYALCAVLNLATGDDDDGNAASPPGRPEPTAAPVQPTERVASAKQRGLLNGKAAEAKLSSSEFANAVLKASGAEPREWESQEAAQKWLARALDRLPAKHVTPIVNELDWIAQSEPVGEAA